MTLLSLGQVEATLGGIEVLRGVTLAVAAGELVGLIGPNGAGKSTLLRAALGLVPARGTIELSGRDMRSLPARERALAASYLPQERDIAWAITVEQLVWLGRAPYRTAFRPFAEEDRAAVEGAMAAMEIDGLRDRPATALSGGEKARVLAARALAQGAPLLLADEPAAGLDPAHQIGLMRTFRSLAGKGHGVVACLHDLGLAARWCTRLILLAQGRIVAQGEPRAVLDPALLREIYRVETYRAEHAGGPIVQPYDLAG